MAVFFNGNLLITPTVASKIDTTALANRAPNVGNVLALVGPSTGGTPKTAVRIGSPQDARDIFIDGPLCRAAEKAFDASAEANSPLYVVGLRVNPATQSSGTLLASAVTVATLLSTDYGLHTTQIKYKIESASTKGKKVSTAKENALYVQDNIYRDAFSVQYTGAEATGVVTVNSSQVVLQAPSGTTVATIDLATYDTVQKLVDRINVVTGWVASVLDGNEDKGTVNGLDHFTTSDAKTSALTITANLQAVIDWINGLGEGFITATRADNVGTVPDNVDWTYLTGGNDGVTDAEDWTDCFTALQSEDVQTVVPLTSDASIHAAADAHCVFMSNVMQMERRAFVGGAAGQTPAEVTAAAKLIQSDRTAQCYPGFYDYNRDGDLTLYPSYYTAALVGAFFSGVNPGTAATNKTFKVRGWERKLRIPADTDDLIEAGVMCFGEKEDTFRCIKSVSTWLRDDNFYRVEMSVGYAGDYAARYLRGQLERYVGGKQSPANLRLAAGDIETGCQELERPEPQGLGLLVGDEESPAYKNIEVSMSGDVMRASVQVSLVIPTNYVLLTLAAVPYSGTVTL